MRVKFKDLGGDHYNDELIETLSYANDRAMLLHDEERLPLLLNNAIYFVPAISSSELNKEPCPAGELTFSVFYNSVGDRFLPAFVDSHSAEYDSDVPYILASMRGIQLWSFVLNISDKYTGVAVNLGQDGGLFFIDQTVCRSLIELEVKH